MFKATLFGSDLFTQSAWIEVGRKFNIDNPILNLLVVGALKK